MKKLCHSHENGLPAEGCAGDTNGRQGIKKNGDIVVSRCMDPRIREDDKVWSRGNGLC